MSRQALEVEQAGGADEASETKLLAGEEASDAPAATVASQSADLLTLAFWFAMLAVVSVTMTVGNKVVMLDFHYPNTITFLQNGTCVLILALCKALQLAEIKPITFEQWKIFSMCALLLSIQIITMLYALPRVAIASTVVFRNIAMVVVAVVDYLFFGKAFSVGSACGLLVATIGMTLYAANDINFDLVGYLWLTANAAATVVNTFWNNVFIKQFKQRGAQTPHGVSLVIQTETLPIVFCCMVANNELESAPEIATLSTVTSIIFAATCVGGLVIAVTYSKLYSISTGTSVVLASTINKAISILVAHVVFHTILSATQIIGLVVCVLGGLWYSLASSFDASKEQNLCVDCLNFWRSNS